MVRVLIEETRLSLNCLYCIFMNDHRGRSRISVWGIEGREPKTQILSKDQWNLKKKHGVGILSCIKEKKLNPPPKRITINLVIIQVMNVTAAKLWSETNGSGFLTFHELCH